MLAPQEPGFMVIPDPFIPLNKGFIFGVDMSGAAGSGLQSEVGLYSYQSGINQIVNPYLCLPTHGKCLNLFSEITV